jgi:NADH:ubiquinone oxidoreductase subunit H
MLNPVVIAQLAILLFVFVMLLSSAAGMVYMERKVAARIQPLARTGCCSRSPTSSSWR